MNDLNIIMSLNIENESIYYKIFEAITIAFAKLISNTKNTNTIPG